MHLKHFEIKVGENSKILRLEYNLNPYLARDSAVSSEIKLQEFIMNALPLFDFI
jgi:hypothetical protein